MKSRNHLDSRRMSSADRAHFCVNRNQVPQNIEVANAAGMTDCSGLSYAGIYAVVSAAMGLNCGIPNNLAQPLFISAFKQGTPYNIKAPASDALIRPVMMPLPTPMSNQGAFNALVPAASVFSPLEVLGSGVALPLQRDTSEQVFATMSGASAGTGLLGVQTLSFSKSNGTYYGISRTQPILGYLVKLMWTSDDASTILNIILNTGSIPLATVSARDQGCQEMLLFIPSAAGTPSTRNGQVAYGMVGTGVQLDFYVYDGGSAASSLGGWQAWVMPIVFTQELFGQLVPSWNIVTNQFSRLPNG